MLRSYLKGTSFKIRENQDWLRWILNLADAVDRLESWHLRQLEFDFDVIRRASITYHAVADLSYLKPISVDIKHIKDDFSVEIIDTDRSAFTEGRSGIHLQALAWVYENIESLKEGVALFIESPLQHQAIIHILEKPRRVYAPQLPRTPLTKSD